MARLGSEGKQYTCACSSGDFIFNAAPHKAVDFTD